jgi:hypothetical protein
MSSRIEIKAPAAVEPNMEHEVEVEVAHVWKREVYLRLIVKHESGEERTYQSQPRRAVDGQLVERFAVSHSKAGDHTLTAELLDGDKVLLTSPAASSRAGFFAGTTRVSSGGRPQPVVPVSLQRSSVPQTEDEVLWMAIRHSTANLSFASYSRFIEEQLCPPEDQDEAFDVPHSDEDAIADRHLRHPSIDALAARRALPFPGVDGYRWLKVATEVFVMASCGVIPRFHRRDLEDAERRMGKPVFNSPRDANAALEAYLGVPPHAKGDETLPYFQIILDKLQGQRLLRPVPGRPDDGKLEACYGILERKLRFPCMMELIWSYWHEEGMLVQSINAISQRFQNRRAPGDRDPLAQLEIDPLRPLNNLLWGYIQDEQHRLTVLRRAHEYDHHYGITLYGKAVASLRSADSRSKFLESFHNLLYKCTQFYKQDDDATVIADGFPVLNAIKETHYLLAQGAHNQFGDLPSTARQEMLMQEWLLARPEMREFLGGRIMVPHPEPWMDRVDAMKTLQGWTDTGAVHFHDLGVFGEQVLLSIRYGAWSLINTRDAAANWARSWRTEIQGYIHAYRAVTGVDLAADPSSVRNTEERYLPPSVHLRNRLASQRRR